MSPEITFGESAAETVLNEFGVTTDNENYLIYQDSGERVKSYYTEQDIHIDEWGGVIDGSTEFVKEDFAEIHSYVKEEQGGAVTAFYVGQVQGDHSRKCPLKIN